MFEHFPTFYFQVKRKTDYMAHSDNNDNPEKKR